MGDKSTASQPPQRLTLGSLLGKADGDGGPNYNSQLIIFNLLLSLRILNAFGIKTFFQPDEYFQSLEPAWQLAFGSDGGAWITWEWREQLRSSIHPWIFAKVYDVAHHFSIRLQLEPAVKANLLLAAPKILQAGFAAVMDFDTARLALRIYGGGSRASIAALVLTVFSPWQWFCSTRTLSNSLETALTIAALDHWPWEWLLSGHNPAAGNRAASVIVPPGIKISLLAAALACILRPTNIIIWVTVGLSSMLLSQNRQRALVVARNAIVCGAAAFAVSYSLDGRYYGESVLPPLKFLHFNLVQELAVFYGKNRPDYYLTEGLPLLLTTALPFAGAGLWQALRRKNKATGQLQQSTLYILALTIPVTITTLSLISHKEVRFIYPLLPILHILAAKPLAAFFDPQARPRSKLRGAILLLGLLANMAIAAYATLVHQRGIVDVMHYLRESHEDRLIQAGKTNSSADRSSTVGFLMPCHSTPWRSHLIHSGIEAWALTCEPPIHVPLSERESYMDEADVFYDDPEAWLKANMQPLETITQSSAAGDDSENAHAGRKAWPERLVFFEQLEPKLQALLAGTRYEQCWRAFNTHFHDDWRRQGDVVVWCLA
ncbi:hypothetical protein MBLNU230_g5657t1 [Neophaeotheca triangularis]